MTYADSDELQYFDLIVECAKKLMEAKPIGDHPQVYWRELTGKQWRNVYQHMTRPGPEYGIWKSTAHRRELAMRFAALSRMAAMAAWYIGIQQEDGEENAEVVRQIFTEYGETMPPLIR